jgi:hypothetical protein
MPRTQPEQYVFGFGPEGEVVSVAEVKRNGRLDHERIEKDETWRLEAGLVVKTELDDGQLEWTVYADRDGDGRWIEVAEGEGPLDLGLFTGAAGEAAAGGGAPVKQVLDDEAHVFRFDAAGRVVAVYEVERDGRLEREDIDRDETFALVNGFVVKTEIEDGRIEQTTYADLDGDGVWHSILLPQPTSLWDGAVA